MTEDRAAALELQGLLNEASSGDRIFAVLSTAERAAMRPPVMEIREQFPAEMTEEDRALFYAQMKSFLLPQIRAWATQPQRGYLDPTSGKFEYSCSHFLVPGSEAKVEYFGVAGNDNGKWLATADVLVEYASPSSGPVIFASAGDLPLVLKAVKLHPLLYAYGDTGDTSWKDHEFYLETDTCPADEVASWN